MPARNWMDWPGAAGKPRPYKPHPTVDMRLELFERTLIILSALRLTSAHHGRARRIPTGTKKTSALQWPGTWTAVRLHPSTWYDRELLLHLCSAATMLYDLNIVWTPQTAPSDLERTLKFSQSLGYNVVALNHTFEAPIPAQVANPIPQIGPAHASFPPPHQAASSTSSSRTPSSSSLPTTLRRATVVITDPSTNHRLPTLAAAYDLLAARPTTDKAFAAACTTMSEIALISLDLSTSHPFRFKPKPCMAAVHRGVLFEVCYSQLVANSDTRARATFIANVLELVRATKGRGVVLSSEARAAAGGVGLRAPADVVNLFACWGLGSEKGMEAVGTNPRAVVVNEGLRRRGFRGVVDIVQAEGRVPASKGKDDGDDGHEDKGVAVKQQKQKNKAGQKQHSGNQQPSGNGPAAGKRKHDGASDHGGGDQASLPVLSKRQAKKLKLAEQREADGPSTDTAR